MDDHPLMQSPPLLTGNHAFGSTVQPFDVASMWMPHCSAQYGQWVAVVLDMNEWRLAPGEACRTGSKRRAPSACAESP